MHLAEKNLACEDAFLGDASKPFLEHRGVAGLARTNPTGQVAEPENVTNVIVLLARDDARRLRARSSTSMVAAIAGGRGGDRG